MADNTIPLQAVCNFNMAKKRGRKTGRETRMEEGTRKERGRWRLFY